MTTDAVQINPTLSFSFFSDPRIALMVEALSSQDEELARVSQKTTEAIKKTQTFLQQTLKDFGASGEHLEKLLAEAQAHNIELEERQEKEMQDLKDESDELQKTLAVLGVQAQECAAKQELLTGQLRAKISEIRNACRPLTRAERIQWLRMKYL